MTWCFYAKRMEGNWHDKYGPIADDGVAYSLGRYHEGTMTIEELAAELQDKYLDQQVMIGSQRALTYLRKIKYEQI